MVRNFVDLWIFSQLPVFGFGIFVFFMINRFKTVKRQFIGVVLFIISIFLAAAFLQIYTYQSLNPQYIAYGFVFSLLALALHFSNIPIIDNPIFRWIGKLSFSIYILHFVVLKLLMIAFNGLFPITGDPGTLTLFLTGLILSSVISFITYSFVEKPGIEIGKIIIAQLEFTIKIGTVKKRYWLF